MLTFSIIYVHTEHKTRRVIGRRETKAALPARWSGGQTERERQGEKKRGEKSRLTCSPTSCNSLPLLPAPTWKSSFTRKIRRGSKICHRRQTSKWSRPRRGSLMISRWEKILFPKFSLESFFKRKFVLKGEFISAGDGIRGTFLFYYFWTVYDKMLNY